MHNKLDEIAEMLQAEGIKVATLTYYDKRGSTNKTFKVDHHFDVSEDDYQYSTNIKVI